MPPERRRRPGHRHCLDYRALYLSFGFEAIAACSAAQSERRAAQVMRRALDWLTAPTPEVGLELICAPLVVRHAAERSAAARNEASLVVRHAAERSAPYSETRCRPAIGPPGTVVTHTLRVRNTGRGDIPDVVVPSVEGARMAHPPEARRTSSFRPAPPPP